MNIVQAFTPTPITEEPTDLLAKSFEPIDQVATVTSLVQELDTYPLQARSTLRERLLTGLTESNVGKYSFYHENSIYRYGYNDAKTIRLAYMYARHLVRIVNESHVTYRFTTILDSRKTGLTVQPSVLEADKTLYGHQKPACFGGPKDGPNVPIRSSNLRRCILEELLDAGDACREKLLVQYERNGRKPLEGARDSDILRSWRDVEAALPKEDLISKPLAAELKEMDRLLRKLWEDWKSHCAAMHRNDARFKSVKAKEKYDKSEMSKFALRYSAIPDQRTRLVLLYDIDSLKASRAYDLNVRFAMSFGFQALCRIKAAAVPTMVFTREIGEAMSMSKSEVHMRMHLYTGPNGR